MLLNRFSWMAISLIVFAFGSGCSVERLIFPVFEPELLDPPPLPLGPFAFEERKIVLDDLGDGEAGDVTLFIPVGAEGPRPAVVWVLGINNRPHYHQSFHEHLASHGFVMIVPDTRDFSFFDLEFHRKNVLNAVHAFGLAGNGGLGVTVDPDRIALGGYSIGATMALFAAADAPNAAALVMWAPTSAPYWTGVSPETSFPLVRAPVLFLLGEFDPVAPPNGFPAEVARALVDARSIETTVIPGGTHLYFQQPSGVDDRIPNSTLNRREQQAIAIQKTREYLVGIYQN